MLDYYGSIIKSETEIDRELIQGFRNRCHESLIQKIIHDLRREQILLSEYSVSGLGIFHSIKIYSTILDRITTKLHQNQQKLTFVYCFQKYFDDFDVCRQMCDQL